MAAAGRGVPVDWDRIEAIESVQVVSPGRSGTRWLADTLVKTSAHQVTHATGRTLAEVGFLYDSGRVQSETAVGGFLQSRLPLMTSALLSGRGMVDLDCKNSPIVVPLAERFPAMRFLVMVRDPVSFIVSGMERGYYAQKAPFTWGHLCSSEYESCYQPNPKLSFEEQAALIAWFWNRVAKIAQSMWTGYPDRVVLLPVATAFEDRGFLSGRLQKAGIAIDVDRLERHADYSVPRNTNRVSRDRSVYARLATASLPIALRGLEEAFLNDAGLAPQFNP